MSAQAFASLIIDKLDAAIGKEGKEFTDGTPPPAMQAVADAITEYILANTIVTVSYNGTIQSVPPSPDPVKVDTFDLVGECAPPDVQDHFDPWLEDIEQKIIAGFQLAPQGHAGLVFPQIPFANTGITTRRPDLTAVHEVTDEDPQPKAWLVVCQGIMDWINSTSWNTAPGPANRPSAPSSGTAFITNITIS